jgi:two-component system sensor histidine kinase YcbA
VSLFRFIEELIFPGTGDWSLALASSFSAFFYYFTYGALFSAFKLNRFPYNPLFVGTLAILFEIAASFSQLLSMHFFSGTTIPGPPSIELLPIAVIRTFFALGFFSIFSMREAHLLEEQQQQRIESMLVEISNLYVETLQLKKSMANSEEATRGCYTLYRSLSETKLPQNLEFAQTALKIAGEIHEIKKDNQRIYAGLSKIISDNKIADYMSIEDIGKAIQKTNESYASLVGKQVSLEVHIQGVHPHYNAYTIFSILNNLVSNAIEAMIDQGEVNLVITQDKENIEFKVSDNGPGILPKFRDAIFEHGFTTKYDLSGRPSTGIGLSYVKEITESLGGTITLLNDPSSRLTCFLIRIPMNALTKRG